MTIRERIQADLKEAMKAGQDERKTVIRGLMAAIKDAEQRKREDLVRQALKKHAVAKPTGDASPETMAAYQKQLDAALAAENVLAQSELAEPEVVSVVQRLVKQRQESIEQARQAGRADVAEAEARELAVLETYLPRQMSRAEVEAEARAIIGEVGATGVRDTGKVMGPLMARLQGRADGKLVSEVVRSLLADSA